MNQVLSDILKSKRSMNRDGSGLIDVHSSISLDEGEFLSRLIAERKPRVSLEVGLAFGISALFICEALQKATPDPRHIVIDPAQYAAAHWHGVGMANLERAGFGRFVEFIEKPSQIALPELVAAGRKIDFAFVDGEHTFDHVLVDYFFIDHLLNVGGLIVFDDTSWPSIRRVTRFVATNRNYKPVGHVGSDDNWMNTRLRNSPREVLRADNGIGLEGHCIAFEKTADDSRKCDDFVEF